MTEPPRNSRAFTMLELLSAILIIAVLTAMVSFFTASYIQWSQQISDKQTLTILNDALTRYKGEGGNVAALTAGAPVGHVVTALQTAVTWGGQGGINHIFLNTGKTYLGRSLSVLGTGAQYRFTRYNTYTNEPGGVTNPNINTAAGGLVGWWKLDEGSGTTAGDSAGGNTGTLTGATLPPWVVGRSGTGNALQFNGSGYVICGSSIGDFPGNAPFSVSCWVYVTSFIPNNWGRLMAKENGSGATWGGWYMNITGSSSIIQFQRIKDGAGNAINTSISAGSWMLVTATYDGTTVKLYVNGTLRGSATDNTAITASTGYFGIGQSYSGNPLNNAMIDDARIYNRALSAGEVSQLYSQ